MKLTKIKGIGLLAAAVFPLYSGFSQDTPAPVVTPPATPPPVPTQPVAPPPAPAPVAPGIVINPSRETQEVVKLTKAGVSEDVILAYIQGSRTFFSLSANDILHLKELGVATPVVTAMLNHDHALRTQGMIPPNSVTFSAGSQFPPPGQAVAEPPLINQGTTNTIQTPPLVPGGSSPPNGDQPPPPQSEVMPVAPGPDYYWAPGYWSWNGGWSWVGGVWYPRAWGWGWRPGWGGHGGWGWRGGGGWHGGGGGSWHGGGGSHGGGGGFGRGH
jgi:uncharacterized membrane protein YgcG